MGAFNRKDGSYGKREHAEERARRLKEQGYDAAIKTQRRALGSLDFLQSQ